MPTTAFARTRAVRSLVVPEANTCRWAASWVTNENWVMMMAITGASASWAQESPMKNMAVNRDSSDTESTTIKVM
ncbi:unannotated protein [freshwater metagenome]|uniref:Unannotated protein n=1 Tax=freshwater metagenome TaxID=449393 RepID=A0A6J6K5X2_9ZZZZ